MTSDSSPSRGGAGYCVEIRDLAFRYAVDGEAESDRFSLEFPELRIARGERVAVIGPSGSGKSTFLSLIAGILTPARGQVSVLGVDLTRATDAERRRFRIAQVGLVFQEFELLEHLSVRENILLPYFVNSALDLDSGAESRVESLASAAGIRSYLDRRPRALSHGERQRVAICRALIARPSLLLADEPTGNLDPKTAVRVLDLLRSEAERAEATLLMVTHDHGLASAFDRVIDFEGFQGGGQGGVQGVAGASRPLASGS